MGSYRDRVFFTNPIAWLDDDHLFTNRRPVMRIAAQPPGWLRGTDREYRVCCFNAPMLGSPANYSARITAPVLGISLRPPIYKAWFCAIRGMSRCLCECGRSSTSF